MGRSPRRLRVAGAPEDRRLALAIDLHERYPLLGDAVLETGQPWLDAAALWQLDDMAALLDPSGPKYHLITRPRGGSKSSDAGLAALVIMATQLEPMAQCYTVAADAGQGMLVLRAMRGWIVRAPASSPWAAVTAHLSKVVTPTGVTMEVIPADSSSAYGLTPALVIVDELGQWCLKIGTKVAAAAGDVAIEDVRPGDRVWTRAGLRRVTWAGRTHDDAPLLTMHTASGRTVTGTPGHRVWTENRGWVEMRGLVNGDRVCLWQHRSSGGARSGTSTSGTGTCGTGAACSCTARYGSTSTAPSRPGTSSTTSTRTRATTRSTTWKRSRTATTSYGTSSRAWLSRTLRSLVNALGVCGTSGRLALSPAPGAGPATCPPGCAPSSVPTLAPNRRPLRRHLALVRDAGPSSCPGPTTGPSGSVTDAVLRVVPEPDRAPVYDLTVEGCHEFYAGGVLVHNSGGGQRARSVWVAVWSSVAKRRDCRLAILTTTPPTAHWSQRIVAHAERSPRWRYSAVTEAVPWQSSADHEEQAALLLDEEYERLHRNRTGGPVTWAPAAPTPEVDTGDDDGLWLPAGAGPMAARW